MAHYHFCSMSINIPVYIFPILYKLSFSYKLILTQIQAHGSKDFICIIDQYVFEIILLNNF